MKVERFMPPKSSFLSVEKDLGIITSELVKSNRLTKLLHYESPDALNRDPVPSVFIHGGEYVDEKTGKTKIAKPMLGGQIKFVPKLVVDPRFKSYIVIQFDNFTPNASNPEFRNNIIEFDIVCHFDQWPLSSGSFQLRPYRIAAELDTLFNGKHLTGIGDLEFLGANQIVLTDEFAGLALYYAAIHGEEDKNAYTPKVEDQYLYEMMFNDLFGEEEEVE